MEYDWVKISVAQQALISLGKTFLSVSSTKIMLATVEGAAGFCWSRASISSTTAETPAHQR